MKAIVADIQYKKAFKEVLTILEFIPKEDYKKIPSDIIETLRLYQDNNFNYQIDFSKNFQNQEVSEIAMAILANFYRDYWATNEEKKEILTIENIERLKIDEQKREKYNPDNIFKRNNKTNINEIQNIETSKELSEIKKEGFIQKVIRKIKLFIQRCNC